MNIRVAIADILEQKVDAAVVNLFEGVQQPGGATGAVDRALGGLISRLITAGEMKGKLKEVTILHTHGRIGPDRIVVVGLGKQKDFKLDTIRVVAAEACQSLRQINARTIATIVHGAGIGGMDPEAAAQAVAEGSLLSLYEFRRYVTAPPEHPNPEELLIVERSPSSKEAVEKGVKRGIIYSEATMLARNLTNDPSNMKTPVTLAQKAQEIAGGHGLGVEIFDKQRISELGMGCLLATAQGSQHEPRLVVLFYRGDPSRKDTIGLVGKGITFDTGGISIKPDEGMAEMKTDMAGAAVVMATMKAVAEIRPKINVTGVLPLAENMPDGAALKPGDVIKAMNGKTIEIISTDAEGRLILADALLYAGTLGLSPIIDVATLTGACRTALGVICSGAFANDQPLVNEVIAAGLRAGEYIWQMPMFEEYKETLKSEVADMKNHGGRDGGAIIAAQFLAEFVESTPWVHLDIAGTARSDKDRGYIQKGSTGVAVRTLLNFILARTL